MSDLKHTRSHAHSHGHGDHHHDHSHGVGHNHGHDHEHMRSHVHFDANKERRDRLRALRKADDKPAFLELAKIPPKREGRDGLTMHLVDTAIISKWQLGTASPAFGSRELMHLPYPAAMVDDRETMSFTYVSLTERADIDLLELIEAH